MHVRPLQNILEEVRALALGDPGACVLVGVAINAEGE